MLPLSPPNTGKYKFLRQEEIIGAEDGKSNLVAENVECFPQENNTFIPTSLTSNGCNGTKNTLSINGDWENQEKLPTFTHDFKLRIDNVNKDIAYCRIEKENV